MMRRYLIGLLLFLTVGAILVPAARAQDGLTDEERALLRRVTAAAQRAGDYPASAVYALDETASALTIRSLGRTLEATERRTLEAATTRLESDPPNVISLMRAEVEGTDPEIQRPYSYTLEAEARLVDGVLYINAAREASTRLGLAPMPQGWIVLFDPAEWPALNALNLGRFLREGPRTSLLDYPDLLAVYAGGVEGAVTTLADGRAAEVITITLGGADLKNALAELQALQAGPDAPVTGPYRRADDDATLSLTVTLDAEDDRLLRWEIDARLTWTGLDLNALDDSIPSNAAQADLSLEMHTSTEITPLDPAAVEPVPAPMRG